MEDVNQEELEETNGGSLNVIEFIDFVKDLFGIS